MKIKEMAYNRVILCYSVGCTNLAVAWIIDNPYLKNDFPICREHLETLQKERKDK